MPTRKRFSAKLYTRSLACAAGKNSPLTATHIGNTVVMPATSQIGLDGGQSHDRGTI